MRLPDLSLLILAVGAVLFPTPTSGWSWMYACFTVANVAFSVLSFNWQVLPAVAVLIVRSVIVDYLQICTLAFAPIGWNTCRKKLVTSIAPRNGVCSAEEDCGTPHRPLPFRARCPW